MERLRPPVLDAAGDGSCRDASSCTVCRNWMGKTPVPPIRVLVTSPHRLFREGVAALLADIPCVQVTGLSSGGEEALRMLYSCAPDVVLLDSRWSGLSSVEVTFAIAAFLPSTRVLALHASGECTELGSLMQAGAHALVHASDSLPDLLSIIHKTCGIRCSAPVGAMPALSKREMEMLGLLASGSTLEEIADHMGVSLRTVDTYRQRVARKFGTRSTSELVARAIQAGLAVSPGEPAVAA